jgi:hypothetical protein
MDLLFEEFEAMMTVSVAMHCIVIVDSLEEIGLLRI